MSVEESKALYRRFVEQVINNGQYDQIPELYTSDYVDHSAPPGAPGGLGGVRAVFEMFRTAFPDVHFVIDDMVGEADLVATRVTGQGTQDGPFMGFPALGPHAVWGSKGIFRVRDGRITEHWGHAGPGGAPRPDRSAAAGGCPAARRHIGSASPPRGALSTIPHDPARIARNKAVASRISQRLHQR